MERAEKIGLGVAAIGHIVLFGVLSLNLLLKDEKPKIGDPAVEITIAGDPGSSEILSDIPLPISAPNPSPDPTPAEEQPNELVAAPPEAAVPPPPAPRKTESLPPDRSTELKRDREAELRKQRDVDARKQRENDAKNKRDADAKAKRESDAKSKRDSDAKAKRESDAKSKRDAAAKSKRDADAKAKSAKDAAARRSAIANAVNSARSGPPAKDAGQVRGEVKVSLARQIQPLVQGCAPSGVDVNKIVTSVTLKLNRDGTLTGLSGVGQTGINDNNRTQAKPMEDCVTGAIRRASPFSGLDTEYYDIWQSYKMAFKGR